MTRLTHREQSRERRKQDLLLASAMAREQAAAALANLQGRADHFGTQVDQLRALFGRPSVRLAGGLAALLMSRAVGRSGPARLVRWALWAWRAWRTVAPLLQPDAAAKRPAGFR